MRALLLACRAAGRAADPLLLLGELALARALLALLLRQALALLLEVGGVVALVGDAAAAVDLQDPAGDVVEEVAVVGDDQHRAGVVAERPLQPGDALGVQVVGRLVEQQQVRLLEQQAAQRDAAALAAREIGHRAFRRRAAQRVQRHLHRAVELPAIRGVDALLQLGLLGEQGVHLVVRHLLGEAHGDLVEAVEVRLEAGEGLHDVLADGLVRVEMRLLRQVADARALRRPGLAAEFLVLPRHDAHEGGLAGAVRAEHADLGVGQEGEGDALEDLAPARIGLGEVLHHVDILVGGHAAVILRRAWFAAYLATRGEGGNPRANGKGRRVFPAGPDQAMAALSPKRPLRRPWPARLARWRWPAARRPAGRPARRCGGASAPPAPRASG